MVISTVAMNLDFNSTCMIICKTDVVYIKNEFMQKGVYY